MEYSKIRKHHKRLKVARWISQHPKWLHRFFHWIYRHTAWLRRFFHWIYRHTGWLRKALRWCGHQMRWMKYLNPFRYFHKLDWYIIKKFIGTYLFSIILIMSISIVFDVNENLSKFAQYHAPLKAIVFDYYMNFTGWARGCRTAASTPVPLTTAIFPAWCSALPP